MGFSGLLLLLALQTTPAATQDSVVPLPGSDWRVLQRDAVRGQGDFTTFADPYTGSPEKWKKSPIAAQYGALDAYPENPTLAQVLDQVSSLLRRVRASGILTADVPGFAGTNGELLRGHLVTELEVVHGKILSLAAGSAALTWDDAKTFVTGRFQPGYVKSLGGDATLASNSVFFARGDTQVVLLISKESGPRFTPHQYYATLDQAIEFRTVAAHMQAIFGKLLQPQLEQTSVTLGQIDQGWTNYLEKGFSQYPWESYANGFLTDYSWSRPPVSQWVLLHPEPAFLMDTRSSRSAELETALLVHGVGYVRYFDDASWFLGASATASVTSDPAYGLGFGPTLHFGHTRMQSRIPHISLGVMWQDFETGGRKPVVAMTLDLWRLVDRGSEAIYSSNLMR